MSISKTDLVEAIIKDAKQGDIVSKAQTERIVNTVFNKITQFVADGESVVINKFGSFQNVERAARTFKTPQGDTIVKSAQHKMVFKSSKRVTGNLN